MKKRLINGKFLIGLTFLYLFFSSSQVYSQNFLQSAQGFKTEYKVEYFLKKTPSNNPVKKDLETRVKFNIVITNLRSDIYVKKFTLSFPNSFSIRDIKAYDDLGRISPRISQSNEETKVELEFSNPNTGKDSKNRFILEFFQDNLFQINGNVWEVFLPTVGNKQESRYSVVVHLPQKTDKKISVAKPVPTRVSKNIVQWDDVKTKIIYAVFGDRQYYQTKLSYHLKNSKLIPVFTYIAFPPDTLYQKIYIKDIEPRPKEVMVDEDGNFLGKYILKPKEEKEVVFKGVIEVFSKARDEVLPAVRKDIVNQKSYLLSEDKYWKIQGFSKIKKLNQVKDIYSFVTKYLTYNYSRVKKNNKRLGADEALKNPQLAVCVEFTDLFVALAREKGILAREIEGYGFSQDKKLRPLSLVSDILHSWPEYYDDKAKLWLPVDPTWENTSGIDYFSSFDLNHITFVIHGKKSDYPLPAGMYKVEDSKDVSIIPTGERPEERIGFSIREKGLEKKIFDNQSKRRFFLFVKNNSNIYVWNIPLTVETRFLKIKPGLREIDRLAPYEIKKLEFIYYPKTGVGHKKDWLVFKIYDKPILKKPVEIYPYYLEIGFRFAGLFLGIGGFIFFVKLLFSRGKGV